MFKAYIAITMDILSLFYLYLYNVGSSECSLRGGLKFPITFCNGNTWVHLSIEVCNSEMPRHRHIVATRPRIICSTTIPDTNHKPDDTSPQSGKPYQESSFTWTNWGIILDIKVYFKGILRTDMTGPLKLYTSLVKASRQDKASR